MNKTEWIWHPEKKCRRENSFVVFQKILNLKNKIDKACLKISADSKYRLVINNQIVAMGPHLTGAGETSLDSYDITENLCTDSNIIEITVQYLGSNTLSYVLGKPGLYCSLSTDCEEIIAMTGKDWQCRIAGERRQNVPKRNWALGFPEYIDLNNISEVWQQAEVVSASPFGKLMNRPIPYIKMEEIGFDNIMTVWKVSANSPAELPDPAKSLTAFLDNENAVEYCWPNDTRNLVNKNENLVFDFEDSEGYAFCIDCGREYTGHPFFELVSESGGTVQMSLAELLQDNSRRPWNNRRDCRYASQIEVQAGTSKWTAWDYSAGRYIHCVLRGFKGRVKINTGILFRHADLLKDARFVSDDKLLNSIWQMGVDTAELCSQDLLVDCPTREQGQYAGDIYVLAPIMMYCFGDVSYCKEGIRQGFVAQTEKGLISARFPTGIPQTLFDYSLMPAMLLHEYYIFTGDKGFVEQQLDSALKSLDAFRGFLGKSGCIELNGKLDYDIGLDCLFIDHPGLGWHDFDYPGIERDGISAPFNFFYILALRNVAELCKETGKSDLEKQLFSEADVIAEAAAKLFWNDDTGYFADVLSPDGNLKGFSQQTNALALLAGIVSEQMADRMIPQILDESNPALCRCSPYFYYFLFKALYGRGRDAEILDIIKNRWGGMIDKGATSTWETFDGGSKDSLCHAWSAAPTYFLLSSYAGIQVNKTAFEEVTVSPRFDLFKSMDAAVATPKGILRVVWNTDADGVVSYQIKAPDDLRVTFDPHTYLVTLNRLTSTVMRDIG